ncbi:hypothetical protein [Pectobacterium brasiliense]|uniref:hypothetical protein n=1 Tax=Pectobacterium brasiliense TaxID=180957 RepID=UPI0038734D70
MPTKHIDDATAAELDDLYVRCVTLTQQPVKEVEVLRLAIQKGISNIAEDDILSAMSVKDSVWKILADTVWDQITTEWPDEGVDAENLDQLAEEYSRIWRQHPSEKCQKHIRQVLENDYFPELSLHDRLFTYDDIHISGRETYSESEMAKKTAAFDAALPSLQGKKFFEQQQEQRDFLLHSALNKQGVILQPDGSGDFTIQMEESAGDRPSGNATH